MKIGIVSNSKISIPLLSNLVNYKKGEISFYFGNTPVPDMNKAELAGFCNANGIALHIEDKKEELYQWQQLYDPDIIFITGYGHKINTGLLSGVSKGLYNIHFGKLPEFRGPSPVFWQLKKGVPEIGITIHELSGDFDSGPIVWEYSLKNEDHHSYNFMYSIFSELQVKGVFELLEQINRKLPLNKKIQDEDKAHYYKTPQLADVVINWDKMEAKEIVDLIKACNSWNNGVSTLINGFELKVIDANVTVKNGVDHAAGTIIITNNSFSVACIKQKWLAINFFNINNTFIPARHAEAYGLKTGQKFVNIV